MSYQQPDIRENSKYLSRGQRDTLPVLPAKLLDPLRSHVLPRSQADVLDSLKVSLEQPSNIEWETKDQSQVSSVSAVVRAVAYHQCRPGSIPGSDVICGLSLLILYSARRGFPPGVPVFPSHQKATFDLIFCLTN